MESKIVNILERDGVILRRLTEDKIEMVRRWRNDPKISQYMEYREIITPEMQQKWFRKIDNEYNHYFIIEVDGKEIGLINIRDVDFEKGEGEPGIFIWNDEYLNSIYPLKALICLTDFCFDNLGLKRMVSHVLSDNPRAIKFNKAVGYRLSPGQENVYNQEYTLLPEDYRKKRDKIVKYLR